MFWLNSFPSVNIHPNQPLPADTSPPEMDHFSQTGFMVDFYSEKKKNQIKKETIKTYKN